MQNYFKAHVLSEALPYIQKYNGKTIIVKYGGAAMSNDRLKKAVIGDIVLLSLVGIRVVIVHGGGPEINETLDRMGIEAKFVNGLRVTDKETLEVAQMVLAGKVSKDLVSHVQRLGGKAVSLSGMDGGLLQAERIRSEHDYGFVGEIVGVNKSLIDIVLDKGFIPVVSSIAMGRDADTSYNINADTAAAVLASELQAEKLILLTDVRGLLRDPKDEETLIPVVERAEVPGLVRDGFITGGMVPKITCCVDALNCGVGRAHILDGGIPHALLVEMFTDEGAGTMIV
jgi:acetylglutamate kinase